MAPADETEVYHRMHEWYHSPERDALRAVWGAYPATPGALQAWPGFVRVTNAFLDYEAAHGRSGESVAAEAEESNPVGASDVRPEVVEGEEGVVTEPVAASETMEREAPAEDAEEESRGWFSSLLGPRRESGAEADAEASEAAPRGVHTLRSWNYPQRRWRVADGDTVKIDEGPATTLRLVPGLYRPGDESGARDWNAKLFAERGAASMVSFALDDGTYLRSNLIGELRAHRPYEECFSGTSESRRFRLDATFYAERGRFYPGSVSFHSVNHNGFYISHGSRFVLKTYYCCDEPDLRRETKKNASFALEAPKGWVSSLLGPRRESGTEASEAETEQAVGEAVGSLEFIGLWKENKEKHDRLMPIKREGGAYEGWQEWDVFRHKLRVALGKLVDELVRSKAPSGILAITNWHNQYPRWGISWSASADDERYQQLGLVSAEPDRHESIRFADFDGAIDVFGDLASEANAVYRVTLPSGGLGPDKWAGRPPPPAPEELYTGPRDDGLLSTDEIAGEYCNPGCANGGTNCNSITVVPLGADTIETWRSGWVLYPPVISFGKFSTAEVTIRKPGTNTFGPFGGNAFSADGTFKQGDDVYHKRPGSQKRAFQKVDARDLAGNWFGCCYIPCVPYWPFLPFCCTRKKALDEDRYEESGRCCCLCLPCPFLCGGTRTRKYVNGHPTNGFARGYGSGCGPDDVHWYRDPGWATDEDGPMPTFCAKKIS